MARRRSRLPFGTMVALGGTLFLRRSPTIVIPVFLLALLPWLLLPGVGSGFWLSLVIVWLMLVSILGQVWATAMVLRARGRRIAGGFSRFALALAALLILRSVHLAPMLFLNQAALQFLGLGCCSAPLFSIFLARFGMTAAFALAGEPRPLTASLRGASPVWGTLALVAVSEWVLRLLIALGLGLAVAGLGGPIAEVDAFALVSILVYLAIDLLVASTYTAGYLLLSSEPAEDRVDELF